MRRIKETTQFFLEILEMSETCLSNMLFIHGAQEEIFIAFLIQNIRENDMKLLF